VTWIRIPNFLTTRQTIVSKNRSGQANGPSDNVLDFFVISSNKGSNNGVKSLGLDIEDETTIIEVEDSVVPTDSWV